MGAREDFLRIYADLPLKLRKEIILVYEKEPLTWNAIFIEVFNETKNSPIFLKKLKELKLI